MWYAETYIAILRGKGSGTGWDMHAETNAARAFLTGIPRPVVFDVGANKGKWSQMLSEAIPQLMDLYLFEPQETCRERIARRTIRGTVKVFQFGLSDRDGTAEFFSSSPTSGEASLYQRRESYFAEMVTTSQSIELRRVDSVVRELGIPHIDLLKIDVEGGELDVLSGAKEMLAGHSISTIAFEFGSANIYSRVFFRDFWDLLVDECGYRIWRILPGGRLVEFQKYSEDLEHFRGVSNYVASLRTPSKGA
jgi:FkbM family methyltransferase